MKMFPYCRVQSCCNTLGGEMIRTRDKKQDSATWEGHLTEALFCFTNETELQLKSNCQDLENVF